MAKFPFDDEQESLFGSSYASPIEAWFDPETQAEFPQDLPWPGYWRATYGGTTPWPGMSSFGSSGSMPLSDATWAPIQGTAVNGFFPASFFNSGGNPLRFQTPATLGGLLLSLLGDGSTSTGWTITVLIKLGAYGTTGAAYYDQPLIVGSTGGNLTLCVTDTGVRLVSQDSAGTTTTPIDIALSLGTWYRIQAQWTGTQLRLRVDGGAWTSVALTSFWYADFAGGYLKVGANYANAAAGALDAEILELGVSPQVWDTTGILDPLNAYYDTRYAIGSGTLYQRSGTSAGTSTATATPRRIAPRAGSSSGVATASLTPRRVTPRTATSAGTATATLTDVTIRQRSGSSSGIATTALTPRAIRQRSGTSAGVATATVTPRAIRPRSATSAGAAAASVTAVSIRPRSATSAGTSTATLSTSSIRQVACASAATSTATATARAIRPRAGTSAGASTATATGLRVTPRAASSSSIATASLTPRRIAIRSTTSASAGAATLTGVALRPRAGSSAGLSTTTLSPRRIAPRAAASSGAATASLTARAVRQRATLAQGTATAALLARVLRSVSCTAAGSSSATLVGLNAQARDFIVTLRDDPAFAFSLSDAGEPFELSDAPIVPATLLP